MLLLCTREDLPFSLLIRVADHFSHFRNFTRSELGWSFSCLILPMIFPNLWPPWIFAVSLTGLWFFNKYSQLLTSVFQMFEFSSLGSQFSQLQSMANVRRDQLCICCRYTFSVKICLINTETLQMTSLFLTQPPSWGWHFWVFTVSLVGL